MMIIPVPFNSYWSVFLTLGCNFKCPYCIQKIYGPVPEYEIMPGRLWVERLNSIAGRRKKRFLRRPKVKKLSLIGGEPAVHPDFVEILNGLDNDWMVTVTSNLSAPIFSDIKHFLKLLKRRKKIKFNVSFHPLYADADEFIAKVVALKKALRVHHIFYVAYPPGSEKEFKEIRDKKFAKKGLIVEMQRFTGFYKHELYPKEDTGIKYGLDYGINDYKFYEEACGQKAKKEAWCKTNKVLFAPNGDIYNCHYFLYTKSSRHYGNLFDENFKAGIPNDFVKCSEFGFCNPCDFEGLQIKTVTT
ncbi:MAG: radical SAM protein [Candidatus Omnitrophota bacterium]|jgi:MoaA/NifB/PqqE/SkfB family radical SAM enzyme